MQMPLHLLFHRHSVDFSSSLPLSLSSGSRVVVVIILLVVIFCFILLVIVLYAMAKQRVKLFDRDTRVTMWHQ